MKLLFAAILVVTLTGGLAAGALAAVISNSTFTLDLDGWASERRTSIGWHRDKAWSNQVNNATLVAWNAAGGGCLWYEGRGNTVKEVQEGVYREGGRISKTISTVGYQNIQVSYDLKVGNLGVALYGAPSDATTVDHNDVQDQLAVHYSTDGLPSADTRKVYTECEWVGRDTLTAIGYEVWATRTINLSAISAANNNAGFELKFSWQFNTTAYTYSGGLADEGWLDNIKVMGDVIPEPSALLAFATGLFGLVGFATRRKRR
jgi:hypothetical protein